METTNKQTKFWETLMGKYEVRNNELRQKKQELQSKLDTMNSTLQNFGHRSVSSPIPNKTASGKICSCGEPECVCEKSDACAAFNQSFEKKPADNAPPSSLSLLSINSNDVECMQKILEFKERENKLNAEIKALENRERAFKEMQLMGGCACDDKEDSQEIYKKLNEVQKELKLCMDRVEGPMVAEIESEKMKSQQLQQQIYQLTETLQKSQNEFQRALCEMKMQFHCTCANLLDVNNQNMNLTSQIENLGCRCEQLQADLARQKLNEADTLRRLGEFAGQDLSECGGGGGGDEDNSLSGIARKLSQCLLETETCDTCRTGIPSDLRETVKGIKHLVEMVDKQSKKMGLSEEGPEESSEEEEEEEEGEEEEAAGEEEEAAAEEEEAAAEEEAGAEEEAVAEAAEEEAAEEAVAEEVAVEEAVAEEEQEAAAEPETAPEVEAEPEVPVVEPEVVAEIAVELMTSATTSTVSEAKSPSAAISIQSETEVKIEEAEGETIIEQAVSITISEKSGSRTSEARVSGESEEKEAQAAPSTCSAKMQPSERICAANLVKEVQVCASKRVAETGTGDAEALSDLQEASQEADLAAEGVDEEVDVKTEIVAEGEMGDLDVDVDTEVEVIEEAPEGVHVTTTITGSGTLEVITEGPAGVIETTMTYTESGNIEVLTEVTEFADEDLEAIKEDEMLALPEPEISAKTTESFIPETTTASEKTSISVVSTTTVSRTSEGSTQRVSSVSRVTSEEAKAISVSSVSEVVSVTKAVPVEAKPSIVSAAAQEVKPLTEVAAGAEKPIDIERAVEAAPAAEKETGIAEGGPDLEGVAVGEEIEAEPITVTTELEIDLDTEDLKKGVAEALEKANREVMEALEQANKDVTGALEKANKDVEDALALSIAGKATETTVESGGGPARGAAAPGAPGAPKLDVCPGVCAKTAQMPAPEMHDQECPPGGVCATIQATVPQGEVAVAAGTDGGTTPAGLGVVGEVSAAEEAAGGGGGVVDAGEGGEGGAGGGAGGEAAEGAAEGGGAEAGGAEGGSAEEGGAEGGGAEGEGEGEESEEKTTTEEGEGDDLGAEGGDEETTESTTEKTATEIPSSESYKTVCSTDETDKKHPPDCDCPECVCKPCADDEGKRPSSEMPSKIPTRVSSKASRTASKISSKIPTKIPSSTARRPPRGKVECDCTGECVCEICSPEIMRQREEREKAKREALKKTPASQVVCDCGLSPAECRCNICSPEVMRQREEIPCTCLPGCRCAKCMSEKRGGGGGGPHPPDCECLDCLCDPTRSRGPKSDKHPPDCDCLECLCKPCAEVPAEEKRSSKEPCGTSPTRSPSRSIKSFERKKSTGHPHNCECYECKCDPSCLEASKKSKKHPPDCDCLECLCDPCADMPEGYVPPKEPCDSSKLRKAEGHPPDCECTRCICDPCIDTSKGRRKSSASDGQHPAKCDCEICTCDPCDDPEKQKEKESHPPQCDCEICVCEPCDDPEREKRKQFHPPGCDCAECFCVTPKIRIKHTPSCDCEICVCDPCEDPDVGKRKHGKGCLCAECACKRDKKNGHPADCECLDCLCESNPDVRKVTKGTGMLHPEKCICVDCLCERGLLDQAQAGFGHPEGCDCPDCVCPGGPKAIQALLDEPPATKTVAGSTEDIQSLDKETLQGRLIEMEKENKQRKEEMDELRDLLQQIKCACREAELQAAVSPSMAKQAASFEMTMSGLQVALNTLEEKSKSKENVIEEITKELETRVNECICERSKAVLPCNHPEYPHCPCTSRDLKKPSTEMNIPCKSPSQVRTPSKGKCVCEPKPTIDVDPSPLTITEVRRICGDNLLIKWCAPASSYVMGYEIDINNDTKSRIMSAQRTTAVIHNMQFTEPLQIAIYATTTAGRCQPPATTTFKP